MDKYIGNKKCILPEIEELVKELCPDADWVFDVFSGTTNVGQYFKQRGYNVLSNDANYMSYILSKAYIENNTFPTFAKVLKQIENENYIFSDEYIDKETAYIKKKIKNDPIFEAGYYEKVAFENNIQPLIRVLDYLNHLNTDDLTEEEKLFFDYYTIPGAQSSFRSVRGTLGRRNYFTERNAKLIGKILEKIKYWSINKMIKENEKNILLTCVIEEVTLNANVNGTFHDFNRKKLYPNAIADFYLKPIMLNIYPEKKEYISLQGDANEICKSKKYKNIQAARPLLYIDPPYNFRQYGAYYHMLNFIARYCDIPDVMEYASKFEFVRGQNMDDNFVSRYCYKDDFIPAMSELIESIDFNYVMISYYDENNHWNHGTEIISYEGRVEMTKMLKKVVGSYVPDKPYVIQRKNYQSQSGGRKKSIDELVFFGRN